MSLPIRHFTRAEVYEKVLKMKNSKTSGFDNIDANVVKSLPRKDVSFLTYIFNAVIRLKHIPIQ